MNEEFEFETFEEQPSLLETEEAEFRMSAPIVRDHRSVVQPGVRFQPPVRTTTAWQRAPAPRSWIRPVYTPRQVFRPAYKSWPVVRPGYTPWSYTRPGYTPWSYSRPGYTARPPYYWRQPMQWQPGYRNASWYWQRRHQNPFAPGGGSRDDQIRWIQHFLNRILNQNLPVDGVMSPDTRTAVRNFQQRYGLPATGYVGPQTQQALVATTQQLPEPDAPVASGDSGAPPPIEPPQATTESELFEFFPQGEFSDNEFESFSDHENWQSELNSVGRGDCDCHGPKVGSGSYQFRAYNPDRESFEFEGAPTTNLGEQVICAGKPFAVLDNFSFNASTLRNDSIRNHSGQVNAIAREIVNRVAQGKLVPSVCIVGHTDDVGSSTYNYGLGLQRARKVKEALCRALGHHASPMTFAVNSLGEMDPLPRRSATPAARASNRRVEVHLLPERVSGERCSPPSSALEYEWEEEKDKPPQRVNFTAEPVTGDICKYSQPFTLDDYNQGAWKFSDLTPHQKEVFEYIRKQIKRRRDACEITHVEITGHSNSGGNPKYNWELGLKRAEVIAEALRTTLPKRFHFGVYSRGNQDLVVKNDLTEREKRKNRRVEIVAW